MKKLCIAMLVSLSLTAPVAADRLTYDPYLHRQLYEDSAVSGCASSYLQFCLCAPLFAVIEGASAEETQAFREIGDLLLPGAFAGGGVIAVETRIGFWRSLEPSFENTLRFGRAMAYCGQLIKGEPLQLRIDYPLEYLLR